MSELARFGRCYAKERRPAALSLIATRPSSREEAETYGRLFRNASLACLSPGTSMRMPVAYVRGAIAEGLYRSGVAVPANLLLPAPTPAEVRNLSDAARCYTAGHPAEVRALLETRAGSKAEYRAVSALLAGFQACLPEGVKVQFDATVVRFRLAEAQLLLSNAAAPSGG